ncbi:MAG: ABC transporter permease [Ignavibacteriales bacterium]|nr:ABC transporter permease [Ignavibacteriales bacterium]
MIELFIARKYSRAKHKLNFIGLLSIISTLGITIGVAALVIVLSVFNGFGSIVTKILVSFDPHVKVILVDKATPAKIAEIQNTIKTIPGIESYYSMLEGKTLFINNKTYEVVNFKGIDIPSATTNWNVSSKIISGKSDLSQNKIVIGLALALKLGIRAGDTIAITSAYNIEKTITSLTLPQTRKLIVSGLFESNNRDYDAGYAFSSLETAQQLFGVNQKISGIEIRLHDFQDSEKIKTILESKIGKDVTAIQTWYDLHKQLYNVMLIERWAAYIILCLIIAVATFNIFASLTMTVIEKKRDIGILRSLGVKQESIHKIFMFSGLMIGIAGTAAGLVIGLLVCYLQVQYKFYPLDPMKYIIDALPIQVRFSDVLVISLMAIFLSFVAAYFPAKRAAKTIIIDSIKYE